MVDSEDRLCSLSLAVGGKFQDTQRLKEILVEGPLYGGGDGDGGWINGNPLQLLSQSLK